MEIKHKKITPPLRLGVVGATGVVGSMFLSICESRRMPISELRAFASAKSAGGKITFCGQDITLLELSENSFHNLDIVMFAAGAAISRTHAPIAVRAGCVVIDNSSHFRMADDVPLVVPEVNPEALRTHSGIIANPNCCAGPACVALKPLLDKYGLVRLVIATYQAVSGAGAGGLGDLTDTLAGLPHRHFPHPIANNIIPHIDKFNADGTTGEEEKLAAEIRKILGKPGLGISATCVRVPIENGHSMAINVQLDHEFNIGEVREALAKMPGLVLADDPQAAVYPMPRFASGKDGVFVGRLRVDASQENSLNMWVSVDNLRKGAAGNAADVLLGVLG